MQNLKIKVIRGKAEINGRKFPMYCGFLSSVSLKQIAEVPNFERAKPHHQIASDIFSPPVDQWQRPLDQNKTDKIKATYSCTQKNNLMANPVLIGIAMPKIDADATVDIIQMQINNRSGDLIAVDDVFLADVKFTDSKKPLWILDGQHRIEGLLKSSQKDEPIPFVLLYDEDLYDPPFLAEIFTQVTTGATPMEDLHAHWMKYAFELDKYSQEAAKKSMEATIFLCKEVNFGGRVNPFHNKVQFNPYKGETGYYAFSFNMQQWAKLFEDNFYGFGGNLTPYQVAEELVKAVKAFESVDSRRYNDSKFFSNKFHKILGEAFVTGCLKYLANHNYQKSYDDWVNFFIDPKRLFNRCDWNLPFVRSTGALSSGNGAPSKIIAKNCFEVVFEDPQELSGTKLTDYLQGVEAQIKVTSFQKTPSGRLSNKDPHSEVFYPASLKPFNVNERNINREIIRVESASPNCYIKGVFNDTVRPRVKLPGATRRSGLDISNFPSGQTLLIETMSYSGDTLKSCELRIDK